MHGQMPQMQSCALREHSPDNEIVPAESGSKCLVDESVGEAGEGSTGGIQCCKFSERLHNAECHETDDAKTDDEGGRATTCKRTASTDETAC